MNHTDNESRIITLGILVIMEIRIIEQVDAITHIELSGRLDIKGVEEADIKFTAYTSSRGKPALVDLSGLGFISSLGLRMLLVNARNLGKKGSKMVLLNPVESVLNILEIAGFDKILPIMYDYDEACRFLLQSGND